MALALALAHSRGLIQNGERYLGDCYVLQQNTANFRYILFKNRSLADTIYWLVIVALGLGRDSLGRCMGRTLCTGITKGVPSRTCAAVAIAIDIDITIIAHCGMDGSGSGP